MHARYDTVIDVSAFHEHSASRYKQWQHCLFVTFASVDFDGACVLPSNADHIVADRLIGTKPYKCPSAEKSLRYSFATDWWSLGSICLERITYDLNVVIESQYRSHSPIIIIYSRRRGFAALMMIANGDALASADALLTDIAAIDNRLRMKSSSSAGTMGRAAVSTSVAV